MRYQRITIYCEAEDGEAASEWLALAGVASELIDASTLEKPPAGQIGLIFHAPEGSAGVGEARALALRGAGVAVTGVRVGEPAADDWLDGWKAFFKPRSIGRFVIVPSWERHTAGPGEQEIAMDPGRAFGTGGHASTRLCLLALAEVPSASAILDVGCGSGVLAIAAVLSFPEARAVAVDVDPEAIEVTLENAAKNGVGARIAASTTGVADVAGRFDLVFGNLSAETLTGLAGAIAARVAPGGRLIASGILAEQADGVARAFAAAGVALRRTLAEDEWRGLVLARGD